MSGYWVVVVSYLIGSFPSAYIVGRLAKGIDIRTIGDKNAGAANVYRNISRTAGVGVLSADIAKGSIAILIAQAVAPESIVFICGVAAMAGHNWPIFLKFKGGRGLATAIGVLLVVLPVSMVILSVIGLIIMLKTHNLVLTGVVLFVPLPFLAWWLGAPGGLILYSLMIPCLVGLMHWITTRHLSDEQRREARHI